MLLLPTSLQRLDAALGRFRRLWESPQLRRRFLERMSQPVEAGLVRTLVAVQRTGEHCGVSDLAAQMSVDISTASRFVDHAVAAGCLSRDQAAEDRRRSVLTVTDRGADLLQQALRVRAELLAELTEDWADEDLDRLAQLLERLADRLPKEDGP